MNLTKKQANHLFMSAIDAVIWDIVGLVFPARLSIDGRSNNQLMRELMLAGYVIETDGGFRATDKILKETPAEPLDLIKRWAEERSCYSGRFQCEDKPVIYFDDMTAGEQVWALTAAVDWHFLDAAAGAISDPVLLGKPLREAYVAYNASQKLCISTQELKDHVNRVVAEEVLQTTMRQNIGHGFREILGLTEEESTRFCASDSRVFMLGDSPSNFGDDMSKWGETCEQRIEQVQNKIAEQQKLLAALQLVRAQVERLGGWEVFQAKLRELVEEEARAT